MQPVAFVVDADGGFGDIVIHLFSNELDACWRLAPSTSLHALAHGEQISCMSNFLNLLFRVHRVLWVYKYIRV